MDRRREAPECNTEARDPGTRLRLQLKNERTADGSSERPTAWRTRGELLDFYRVTKGEELDIVEGSAFYETEKETARSTGADNAEAPTTWDNLTTTSGESEREIERTRERRKILSEDDGPGYTQNFSRCHSRRAHSIREWW